MRADNYSVKISSLREKKKMRSLVAVDPERKREIRSLQAADPEKKRERLEA